MTWFWETDSDRRHREIMTAMNQGFSKMAERIQAVLAKFDLYRQAVETFMTTVETAKMEAIRADDAGEDGALAALVAAIDTAHAKVPPGPVVPPVEPVP